ncbi:MAG: trigger factor [Myxococcales bacterium]|nr:trigger factor [Myxococcales bacterium]
MKVRVEEVSPIERKLSIEVEQAVVAQELDRAYKALSRQVKIAGFRPGKVPRRILEQRFKEQVEDDVIHQLVQRAFFDAIHEHKVEAVGAPRVTNEPLKADAPFAFEARVEVKPKVEPKDYKGLALKQAEVKVPDEKVMEQLEQIRRSLSRLEPIEGREVAKAGDFALIDYQGTCEGKEFPGGKAENVTVEIAPGELIEGNVAALEGMKVGEEKETDYPFPPDYRVAEVKGKTARFKLRLRGLKARVIPELNDDFAKEVGGGAQTLEELKVKVRTDLERALKARAATDERDVLVKALAERNPIEVPRAMVERALDVMLEGAFRMLARGGLDPRSMGMDMDRLREDMRGKAELEVKASLLLEAVAEQEGLQATDEDIEKKLEQLAEDSSQALSQVRKRFKGPDERRNLAARIREEKTIEFLKSQATYS